MPGGSLEDLQGTQGGQAVRHPNILVEFMFRMRILRWMPVPVRHTVRILAITTHEQRQSTRTSLRTTRKRRRSVGPWLAWYRGGEVAEGQAQ
jgi:hypothetical protein